MLILNNLVTRTLHSGNLHKLSFILLITLTLHLTIGVLMKSIPGILIIFATFSLALPLNAQDTTTAKGKFSGEMYFDYFYNIQQRDTSKKDLNGFQFRRIYFTYDYAIASNFD